MRRRDVHGMHPKRSERRPEQVRARNNDAAGPSRRQPIDGDPKRDALPIAGPNSDAADRHIPKR